MSSACTERNYTTPSRLEFTLYCKSDQTEFGHIGKLSANTVEECMTRCSTFPRTPCGAATFDSSQNLCWLKNLSVTSTGRQTGDALLTTLGVANRFQFEPIGLLCPNNQEVEMASNGLNFKVYCDQNISHRDMCTDDNPECRSHASTFGDCLDHCSTLKPLCSGVSWDPRMKFGFTNCYPKTGSKLQLDDSRVPHLFNSRVGIALFEDAKEDECRSHVNGTLKGSLGDPEIFQLSCDEDRTGHELTVEHAASLDKCVRSCTTYIRNGTACSGAVFDSTMAGGYENCYLKSTIGDVKPNQKGFTFALRTVLLPTPDIKEPSPGSKAWIAGPVVGCVAAIAILLGGLWWQQRRTQRKRGKNGERVPELAAQEGTYDKSELELTAPTPKHELSAVDEARPMYELGDMTRR